MNVAQQITQQLGGNWHGTYGMVCCPTHDDRVPSLKVYCNDVTGEVGFHCFGGCDWRDIKDELRRQGVVSDWTPEPETSNQRLDREQRQIAAEEVTRRTQDLRTAKARSVFGQTKPASETFVSKYLRNRGITSQLPLSIRGHDSLYHSPTGNQYPAMVAEVLVWPGCDATGIHRTFLSSDGCSKAGTKQDKMMLGSCAGGAVRLGIARETLAVTEGIETGLSVTQATGLPTWAALSAGGIVALVLPPVAVTKHIVICADNDPTGLKAANTASRKWSNNGYAVRIAHPKAQGMDFNDTLVGEVI
jgi:putative DNA primase/helicase